MTTPHDVAMPTAAEARALSPAAARARFRAGLRTSTAGWCAGWTQANLIAVPQDLAYDLLLFAQRNPKACPVLDVGDPGAPGLSILDGDIRTDAPGYRVYRHGELVDEPADALVHWREDLVAFLIGCSFTFEDALLDASVPLRHVEQGRNVSMYTTNRRTRPAGRLGGPLVVSMRPIPADRVADAVRITARYPAVHGAPVHVGEPEALGIADLARPDFGEAVELHPGDIPVFWACGVTPQAAVIESRPEFAIGHAPGCMMITDARDETLQIP